MDDSQKKSRHDMIIGRDLLSEIQLDLCFSDHTIRENGGEYEVCTISMKGHYDLRDDTSFRDEEL